MPAPTKTKSKISFTKRRDFLRPRSPVVACTPVNNKSIQKVKNSPVHFSLADEAEAHALKQHHQQSLPKNVCTRQHIPSHATFALTQINSLLQYVAPGSIVAFDIDDTLIKKRHFGCSLLTTDGMRMFHSYIQQNMKDKPFTEKQELVNALHKEVKSFDLAESDTADVIKALQNRGCYVFGLTARASTMANATNISLASLDLDLSLCPPPTLPKRAVEPNTSAAIIDGIVYCNDVDKGVVFQRLLQLNWISWPNKHTCNGCPASCPKTTTIASNSVEDPHHTHSEDGKGCPERTVWFVDDSLPMISGMISQWGNMAQTQAQLFAQLGPWSSQIPCRGKLALVCCNYTHPTAASTPQVPPSHVPFCVELQIREFLANNRIISDVEAYNMLRAQQTASTTLTNTAVATACQ